MLFPVDPPNEASATSDVKQELSSEQQSELARLSREPFGHSLARQVAHHLKKRGAIAYNHRDYCGTGLFYLNGEYLHTVVDDGHPVPYFGRDRGWSFEDQHAFVAWLAGLRDGHGPHRFVEDCRRLWPLVDELLAALPAGSDARARRER